MTAMNPRWSELLKSLGFDEMSVKTLQTRHGEETVLKITSQRRGIRLERTITDDDMMEELLNRAPCVYVSARDDVIKRAWVDLCRDALRQAREQQRRFAPNPWARQVLP
jgi:hypothetical protein